MGAVRGFFDDPAGNILAAHNPGGIGPGGENDPFFGGSAAAAAREASATQSAFANTALEAQLAETAQTRADLAPFREFGAGATGTLAGAISDPSQRVLNNPFFTALAGQQEQRLLSSAAARGKVGSGGTGDDLQRNLLLLGNQFAQQDIGNLQNQVNTGLNAAAQTGSFGQQGVGAAGGILGNLANAQAAGITGAANAQQQGGQNLLGAGIGLIGALSDIRLKKNIRFSHTEGGIRLYDWNWTDEALEIVGDQGTHGPIAQELMTTHPELVKMDESIGFYRVLI